jgi:hypothetical protein
MTKVIDIIIENRLTIEKRGINVYQHSTGDNHFVRHKDSITVKLKAKTEKDFLHISVVRGPGVLENECIAKLQSWVDFELSHEGSVSKQHSGNQEILKIPPGAPNWQLKITQPDILPVDSSKVSIILENEENN